MKQTYERAVLETVVLSITDIVSTSGWTGEGPIVLPEDVFG